MAKGVLGGQNIKKADVLYQHKIKEVLGSSVQDASVSSGAFSLLVLFW